MAGTFVVNAEQTFAQALLLTCGPKPKFGAQAEQEVSKDGTPKWQAEVAVTWQAVNGVQAAAEVIKVTITAPYDPGQSVMPGMPVTFEGFMVGISQPEKNDKGGIRGGKPWYSATALHPASGTNGASGGKSKAAATAPAGEGS